MIDNSAEIKEECEYLYEKIKQAQKRIDFLRETCPHNKTFEGNYYWAVGHFMPGVICESCGKLIKYIMQ